MQLPCLKSAARFICMLMIAAALPGSASAQDNPSTPVPQAPSASRPAAAPAQSFKVGEYAKPRSHFPNPIGPYVSRTVPSPNLTNTPRLDELLQNGKLMLSMNDAIALALENNLDIAISRYNLHIADTDVLRTKAGASLLGVNTGVVQGTPGGGVGGFGGATSATGGGAGGTTGGGGGAGSGTLGIVSSTLGIGSQVLSYDPIITGTLQLDRNNQPSTSFFSGGFQSTATVNWNYQQAFTTGTLMSVTFDNTRFGQANPVPTVSPQLNSNFRLQLSQHLLQGFGFTPNRRFIVIAKNNRELTDVAFRLQVTTTVDQIQNMYWDLVNAYENVKVQQDALALAERTLSDNKKQVEIGTLAPIEIVRAQSQVATSQQSLIVAKTNLELQQLLMKNALSRTVQNAALIEAEVIPTDTMRLPAEEEAAAPTQDFVNDALGHRPELAESRIDLKNREISMKAVKNSLLPSVDLFAYYGGQGLGGSQNPANVCGDPRSIPGICTPPGEVFPPISIGGTLGQLFDSSHPDKGAGISINIPLRNRTAQANNVRSQLEYRQAQLRLQQVENEVRIEVRNAQFALQQNRASVAAAQAAVDLAQQSLDAEQKKYALGASTSTLVLQQSSALTQGRSNLVAARAAYEKARVELDRATGLLLEHNGIDLADAQSGVVSKLPSVPYVMPRSEAKPESITPLPAQPAPQATPENPAPPQS
jgi:outer membrane protein TolC